MTDIDGFDDFAAALEAFAADVDDAAEEMDGAVDRGVETTARDVETATSIRAPKDTNRLANSYHTRKRALGDYIVGTTVDYAPPVEYGSAPHVIEADDADALHFQWQGEEVFFASVQHPGTPAQPHLRPALNEHDDELVENIVDEIEALLEHHLN